MAARKQPRVSPVWTPQRSARLVSLLDLGFTVGRAAKILGTTPNSCYIHLRRIGHEPPNGNRTIARRGRGKAPQQQSPAEWHNFRWPGAQVQAGPLCPEHLAFLIRNQHIMARVVA